MSDKTKVFDEFQVECTECEHYWDNSCDGVKCFEEKHCTSYKATKRMEIPKAIDKIKSDMKHMDKHITLIYVLLLIHMLSHLIWG
jgi:hypothetical protein